MLKKKHLQNTNKEEYHSLCNIRKKGLSGTIIKPVNVVSNEEWNSTDINLRCKKCQKINDKENKQC